MLVDIVIKNCKVVSPWGIRAEGIAIDGEQIVALATDVNLPEARRAIDAKGNYVIPGVLDTHCHLGMPHTLEEDSKTETIAAAFGGTTTIGNTGFAGQTPHKGSYVDKFEEWKETYEKNAVVDAWFNNGVYSPTILREIPITARRCGITSFKFLMAYKGPEGKAAEVQACDDGALYTGFKEVASLGHPGRAMVHAENADIIYTIKETIQATGRQDLAAWTETRPAFTEVVDVERAISLAKVTKVPLYVVHISAAGSVDAIARAKAEGVDVIGETCPHYLTLTKDDPLGPLGKVNPPVRDKEHIDRLWQGIREGTIGCIGTDHCSFMKERKQDMWTGNPGLPGIEFLLTLMLSEGVNKSRITLEKLVEVCSYNSARVFGVYPKKGTISVGSDADLVIIDLEKKGKLSAKTGHQRSDYTPYEGREVKGWPLLTMVRGKIVVEDGKLIAEPGHGKYIWRSFTGG